MYDNADLFSLSMGLRDANQNLASLMTSCKNDIRKNGELRLLIQIAVIGKIMLSPGIVAPPLQWMFLINKRWMTSKDSDG